MEEELALKIITKAFSGKVDLAGKPYLEHILRVADKFTGQRKIVALLHDLLEDCPGWTATALSHLFDDDIVTSVVAITKKPNQHYDAYIDQVLEDSWAIDVKIHDLRDNMDLTRLPKDLEPKDFARIEKYHKAYLRIQKESLFQIQP